MVVVVGLGGGGEQETSIQANAFAQYSSCFSHITSSVTLLVLHNSQIHCLVNYNYNDAPGSPSFPGSDGKVKSIPKIHSLARCSLYTAALVFFPFFLPSLSLSPSNLRFFFGVSPLSVFTVDSGLESTVGGRMLESISMTSGAAPAEAISETERAPVGRKRCFNKCEGCLYRGGFACLVFSSSFDEDGSDAGGVGRTGRRHKRIYLVFILGAARVRFNFVESMAQMAGLNTTHQVGVSRCFSAGEDTVVLVSPVPLSMTLHSQCRTLGC